MGCNCGKPKPGPLGSKPKPGTGLTGQTQSFTLQRGSKTETFTGSLLEAQALAVRTGSTLTPKKA